METRVWRLRFGDSGLETRIWKLGFGDSDLETQIWIFRFGDSDLEIQIWSFSITMSLTLVASMGKMLVWEFIENKSRDQQKVQS